MVYILQVTVYEQSGAVNLGNRLFTGLIHPYRRRLLFLAIREPEFRGNPP